MNEEIKTYIIIKNDGTIVVVKATSEGEAHKIVREGDSKL